MTILPFASNPRNSVGTAKHDMLEFRPDPGVVQSLNRMHPVDRSESL